jgi:hypothetical protein
MGFWLLFPPAMCSAPQKIALQQRSRRLGRVNIVPTPGRILCLPGNDRARAGDDLHQFKTKEPIAARR